METKTPLHDDNLEENVLGTILHISREQFMELREQIDVSCFYNSRNAEFYSIACKLADEGNDVDMMTMFKEVNKNNGLTMEYFTDISHKGFLNYVDLLRHIPLLVTYSQKRKLYIKGLELVSASMEMDSSTETIIEKLKHDCDEILGNKTADVVTMQKTLQEFVEVVNNNVNGTNNHKRTQTGFAYLDNKGGLQSSDLIIIGGATSMGKTSLADSIVLSAIEQDHRVAFYSLEMNRLQLTSRLLSTRTKIFSNRMLNSPLSNDELIQFDKGVGEMWNMADNLFFDDRSSSNIDSICGSIRRLKAKHDIHGAVVDYLQIISGQEKGVNKEQFMGACSRKLKNLAKELDIWVIALAQVHRDKENPMPSLDRLRDSGQIAEAADVVLMIYRPEYYNKLEGKNLSYPTPHANVSTKGTALILLEKGRNIGTGKFVCGFDADTTHFYDLDTLPDKSNEPIEQTEEEKNKEVYVQQQLKIEQPF